MSIWDCPNCSAPCSDAKMLLEHIVSTYLIEKTSAPSSFSNKRRRWQSEDREFDRVVGNEVDYVCPCPRCDNKKQYPSKFNLLRHFFTHYPDSKDKCLQCPCCLKPKENLGLLSAHWEKSCKRKFGTTYMVNEEEQHRLERFENKKVEMGMCLTRALNEALDAPRKQARRVQPNASDGPSGGSEDCTFTTEPFRASSCREPSMSSAWPVPGLGREVTYNAVSNLTSTTVTPTPGTSNSSVGNASHNSPTANPVPGRDSAIASTAPIADIHAILSTFEGGWPVIPPFGGEYDLSEVDNRWWIGSETDFDHGHNSEQISDSNWYTGIDLEARAPGFSPLPP